MIRLIFAALAIVALMFVIVLMSTVIGGVVGWIVEAVFPWVIGTLNQLSGLSLTGFEMGAVLGFFGSFFRSTSYNKSNNPN